MRFIDLKFTDEEIAAIMEMCKGREPNKLPNQILKSIKRECLRAMYIRLTTPPTSSNYR